MDNTTILVSIAMATFNGEKYISQQLESIITQTHNNLEIIITDDASTDSTMNIIETFQRKYDFIKLSRHAINLGINPTFVHSIKNCSGSFIAICDQDDMWAPDKIEVLLHAIEKEDLAFSNSELVDKNGESLNIRIDSFVNLRSYYSGAPILMGIGLPGHTILMKADFAKSILPIPGEIMYDRWISFCAAANNGIKYVDKTLVKYRQHETNVFGAGKPKNKPDRKTTIERFNTRLVELKAYEKSVIQNAETRQMLKKMLEFFNRKISFGRCAFFFKNRNALLVIKKRSSYGKILYCFKMFFKANY